MSALIGIKAAKSLGKADAVVDLFSAKKATIAPTILPEEIREIKDIRAEMAAGVEGELSVPVLRKIQTQGDQRGLLDALRNIKSHTWDRSGKGEGGTGLIEEALKPAWAHSGRKVQVVNMTPKQYLEKSAKGHGISYDELVTQLQQGDRTDSIIQGMTEGKQFTLPYLDYRNGFGQEGQHRALAAMQLGQERLPVAVMWDENKAAKVDPSALDQLKIQKVGAAGAVAAAGAQQAQGGTSGTQSPEVSQIASDEGTREDGSGNMISYKDSKGLLTGGIGHLMTSAEKKQYPEGTAIPEAVTDRWFLEDTAEAEADAEALLKTDVPEEVRNIITNMSFNLGRTRLKGFKKMFKAIENEDWGVAADEMEDSKWRSDVGDRAKRLIARMRSVKGS